MSVLVQERKSTRNHNRVPKKQWGKWSKGARQAFNRVYTFMMENPDLMNHPNEPRMKPFHWKTVAWNAAWIAADAVDDCLPTVVVTLDRGREVARKKIV